MALLITSVFGVTGCGSDDGELGESKQEVAEVQEESETASKSETASPTTTTVPPTPTTTTTLPALKTRGGNSSEGTPSSDFGCGIIDGLAENNLDTLYQDDYEDYLDGWNIRFYGNLRDQLENLNEYQLRVTLAILDDYGLLDSLDLRDLHDLFGIQIVGILDRFEFSRQDMNDLLDLLELHDMFMLLDSSGYLKSLDVDDSYLLDLWDKIDERDLLGGRDASSDSEASVMSEDLRKTLDLVWEETFFDRDLRDFLDQMDSLDYRDRSAVPENGELIGLLYQSDDWDLVALLAWRDMVDDFDFNHSLDIDFDNLYSLFSECKYEGTLTD